MNSESAQKQAQAWQENVRSKIQEVRDAFNQFYSALAVHKKPSEPYKIKADALLERIRGLRGFFADATRPSLVNDLTTTIQNLIEYPQQPDFAQSSFRAIERLDQVLIEVPQESFDSIFESYKQDGNLNHLVSSLIDLLDKIIREGDESINAALLRDLSFVVDRLRKRTGFSLNELLLWLDSAGALMLRVVSVTTGLSALGELADIVGDAKKTVEAAKSRVVECHEAARLKTVEKSNLGVVYKQLSGGSRINTEPLNESNSPKLDNTP